MHPGKGNNSKDSNLANMSVPTGRVGENPNELGSGDRLANPNNPHELSVAPGIPNAQADAVIVADVEARFLFLEGKKSPLCAKDSQKYRYVTHHEELGRPSSNTLSANNSRGGQSDQAEGQIATDLSEDSAPNTPTLDLFVEALHELRARMSQGECPRVVSISTGFPESGTQRLHRGEWMFKTVAPSKRKAAGTVRYLLLAEIIYVTGEHLLVGELERTLPSDKFAVLCFKTKFRNEHEQGKFIRKLCQCIGARGWIPAWDSVQRTYDVAGRAVPGLRLTHTSSQKTPADYAVRLAAL